MTVPEANAMLTGEGGFFETETIALSGIKMTSVKNRFPDLRTLLANSANHGEGTARYYVFDDGREATFVENIASVASVASALAERHGIGHGDRVAILAANCPEWIEAFWATTSLGGITVAMNGWWTADEVNYALALTSPKLLVVDRRRLERMDSHPDLPMIVIEDDFDALRNTPADGLPTTPLAEDDPACILFTSGTTGRPKGAVTTHRNFIAYLSCAFILGARDAFRFPPEAGGPPMLTLAASPLFHVSGLHSCAVTAVASGSGHVWTTGRFDPEKVLKLTQQHGITRWGGVTTQLWRIIQHPNFTDFDTSTVNSIGGGGSVWSPDLQRACRDAIPHAAMAVGVGYGLTECSGLATHASDDILRDHPDTVGYPIPTADISIHDDDDQPMPDGEVGNVMVKGPMVIAGYWDNEEATSETIRPGGWLRTGDFGSMRDGMVFLASRRTDLIIRGGENIYPVEIENRLDEHPDVVEVAVVGVEHQELGQEVMAYLVLAEGSNTATDDLRAWVAQTLAGYKVPTHWELKTDPLPRNATGKVLKKVLTGEADNTFVEE